MFRNFFSARPNRLRFFTCFVLLVVFGILAISGRAVNLISSAHIHKGAAAQSLASKQDYEHAHGQDHKHANGHPSIARPSRERGHEKRHEIAMQLQSAEAAREIAAKTLSQRHDHSFIALHQHASDPSAKWVDEIAHGIGTAIEQDSENSAHNLIAIPSYCVGFIAIKPAQAVASQAVKSPTSAIKKRIERPPINPIL